MKQTLVLFIGLFLTLGVEASYLSKKEMECLPEGRAYNFLKKMYPKDLVYNMEAIKKDPDPFNEKGDYEGYPMKNLNTWSGIKHQLISLNKDSGFKDVCQMFKYLEIFLEKGEKRAEAWITRQNTRI